MRGRPRIRAGRPKVESAASTLYSHSDQNMQRQIFDLGRNDIVAAFYDLDTPKAIAELLGFEPAFLKYLLYVMPEDERYRQFEIPKRTQGTRKISAPIAPLKELQQRLNIVLQTVYEPTPMVHGFTIARSIVTNAKLHSRRQFVFNIDLEDFFPSINFGRVRGMFMAHPHKCNPAVATVLAQICCWKNQLPQGAPTSPVVSNMLCARLDGELQRLANDQGWVYTRYADDLSFSTFEAPSTMDMVYLQDRHKNPLPVALANDIQKRNQLRAHPGDQLLHVIGSNGFKINRKKVRLQVNWQRQVVTGLITNQFPNVARTYVRQIRAMLHAWEKFGHEAAEKEYYDKYNHKYRHSSKSRPRFRHVLRGKIQFLGMVRGKTDEVYIRYWNQLVKLAPEFGPPRSLPERASVGSVQVLTEGKTDWKHLRAALTALQENGRFLNLAISFEEKEDATGEKALLHQCQSLASSVVVPLLNPHIFIFDRDNTEVVRKVEPEGGGRFRDWGNNVYSFAIPTPDHRKQTPGVCIELYYSDAEIMRKDREGRRLFLSSEFNNKSFRHLEDKTLNCSDRNIFREPQPKIIDGDVYDETDENVALSKNTFANNIAQRVPGFEDFDFSPFRQIFEIIKEIQALSTR